MAYTTVIAMDIDLENKAPRSDTLSSFCVYPQVRLDSLHEEEKLILLLRSHPLTQLPWIFTTVVLLFFPVPVSMVLAQFLSPGQIFFFIGFTFLLIFSYSFMNILIWLFNVGIVTDQRVIDLDYANVLQKELTEAANADIADVTAKFSGFIPTFFDYGDVLIQTAGVAQGVEFLRVPHPSKAASIISQLARIYHENA